MMKPVLIAMCLAGVVFGQDGLFGPYFKTVTVNTKASGAAVATDLVNFPLLVRLNSANAAEILAEATAGGGDIRVTNAAGTEPVAFEIEAWDPMAGKADIWVLAPLVRGSDSGAAFRIYWGRPGAANSSTPSVVFDTSNGFQAVWHMSAEAGDEADATVNGFTATAVGAPSSTPGVTGRARGLDGVAQRFLVANSAAGKLDLPLTGGFTLSAWVRAAAVATGTSSGHSIIDKSDNQYIFHLYGGYWDMITRANNKFHQAGSAGISDAVNAVGNWRFVVGVHRGGALGGVLADTLYVDGVAVSGILNDYLNNTGRNTTSSVSLGAHPGVGSQSTTFSRFWNGSLDEIRILNQARSAAWIKLEYATQRPGTTVVTVGGPFVTALGAAGNPAAPSFYVRLAGRDSWIRFDPASAAEVRLVVTDARGKTLWRTRTDPRVANEVRWNHTGTPPGLYFLRAAFFGADGRAEKTMTRKISLLP